MNLFFDVIRTLFGYFIVGILAVICFPPCLLIACLPERWRRDNPIYFFFVALFFKGVCWATMLPITYQGLENIPDGPVIFAPNHLSSLDIPMVGSLLGFHPHAWLFLKRFADIPVFGFIARRMNVVVDLASPQTMMSSLKNGIRLVKGTGRHLILFPEGGRAVDGNLQRFFPGVSVIAQATNLQVVPVYLHGLDKAYPIGSFLVRQYPITIRVGKPMRMQEGQTRDQFMEQIYQWFLEQTAQ
ncbi:MAG: lysophospholipid acyltransferase family protein [Candidatus Babeliales bacterium]